MWGISPPPPQVSGLRNMIIHLEGIRHRPAVYGAGQKFFSFPLTSWWFSFVVSGFSLLSWWFMAWWRFIGFFFFPICPPTRTRGCESPKPRSRNCETASPAVISQGARRRQTSLATGEIGEQGKVEIVFVARFTYILGFLPCLFPILSPRMRLVDGWSRKTEVKWLGSDR